MTNAASDSQQLAQLIDIFLENFNYLKRTQWRNVSLFQSFFNAAASNDLAREAKKLSHHLTRLKSSPLAGFADFYEIVAATVSQLAQTRFVHGTVVNADLSICGGTVRQRVWQPLPPGRFEDSLFRALSALVQRMAVGKDRCCLNEFILRCQSVEARPVTLVAGPAGKEQLCSPMGESYHCLQTRIDYAKAHFTLTLMSATELQPVAHR